MASRSESVNNLNRVLAMSDDTVPEQGVQGQGLEATAEKPKMRWYVVQAFSNYEKRVTLTLE
jgi:hypothetical protein